MQPSELLPFSALLELFSDAKVEQCEKGPQDPAASLSSKSIRKEHMTTIGVGAYRARKLPTGGNCQGGE